MKKRIFTLMLATSMVAVMLVGCGDKSGDEVATTQSSETHVGSDGRDYGDNGGITEVTGDAPAGETSTGTEQSSSNDYDYYIEDFGMDSIPAFDMELTSAKIEEYLGEESIRYTIACAFESSVMVQRRQVFNRNHYSSTLEMIEDAQNNNEDFGDIFSMSYNNYTHEDAANWIDAIGDYMDSSLIFMTTGPNDMAYAMFYYDNGTAYYVGSYHDNYVVIGTSTFDERTDDFGNAIEYHIYDDGKLTDRYGNSLN